MKLSSVIQTLIGDMLSNGQIVHTERWQAMDISNNPHAKMVEILHRSISAPIETEDYNLLGQIIEPNQPWVDNHFMERVCGYPINPGAEWANWPWAHKASESLNSEGMFNHNYMERYWPKRAGMFISPTETATEFRFLMDSGYEEPHENRGIGLKSLGDLGDVVSLLSEEPDTRQAFLPVWFPEDTGNCNSGRKPCTIGYHFIMRNGRLDITYYIRSCDLARHFRDDVYLTIRLLLWVLSSCRMINPDVWNKVIPGQFIMHITSLHMFLADYQLMFKRNPRGGICRED